MSNRTHAVVQHYRAHLKAQEQATERHLRTAHADMVRGLQPAITRLLRDLEQARQAATDEGQSLSSSWLHEHSRLTHFKHHVSQAVDGFGQLAALTAQHAEQQARMLGTQAGQAQIAILKEGKG